MRGTYGQEIKEILIFNGTRKFSQ